MKKSQVKDLPNKTLVQLRKELVDLRTDYKKKTIEEATGKLKKFNSRNIRKDIARVLTFIRIKELESK